METKQKVGGGHGRGWVDHQEKLDLAESRQPELKLSETGDVSCSQNKQQLL